MIETRVANVLHVSDLHFTKASRHDFSRVWKAFESRVLRFREHEGDIDYVCITGDFVQAADEDDSFNSLIEDYFLPLFDRLNCYDRAIFCPGNHDASRKFVDETRAQHQALLKRLQDGEQPPDEELIELQEGKFASFNKSCGVLSAQWRVGAHPLFPIYYDKNLNTGFVCLNSALLSFTGLKKHDGTTISDERKLFVPHWILDRALAAAPKAAQWIFLLHHPLDWLHRESGECLHRLISEKHGILLHGHMHAGRPSRTGDIFGDYFRHQAGALFSGDEGRFNGYSVVKMMPGYRHFEVSLESYFPIRDAFDAALDICPNGRFYSSPEAELFWKDPPVPTNTLPLKQWAAETLLPYLNEEFRDAMAERPLTDIFVEPPLSKINAQGDAPMSLLDDPPNVELSDLLATGDNLLFVAGRESSRSSLLRVCGLRLASRAGSMDERAFCTIPALVNFASFSKNMPLVVRALRNALPDGLPSGWNALQLLRHGLMSILIDDFNGSDEGAVKVLTEFMRQYPKNRYVLIGERRLESVISSAIQVELPVPVTAVEIKQLMPKHVRSLIARWRRIPLEAADPLLKRILDDTLAMNLPLTANNVSIMVQLDEVPEIVRPVNRAALVERYIELLLRKTSLTQLLQSKYDFQNKAHFLAWIASQMVFDDRYAVENDWLENCGKKYVEKFELDIPTQQWLREFIDARILIYDQGSYLFRFRAFLEYFVAQGMRIDKVLMEHVTDEARFLAFANEIEFCAGITRSDESLLELIAGRFETLRTILLREATGTPELRHLNAMPAPRISRDNPGSLFADVERQLHAPPTTYQDRDEAMARQLPKGVGEDQKVRRPYSNGDEDDVRAAARFLGLLDLYSRLVKNTELIDREPKRRHLEAF